MSLLRALRAYVGLGPDHEYDDPDSQRRDRRSLQAASAGRSRGPRVGQHGTRPGGYLDDLERRRVGTPLGEHGEDIEVVDITSARIDAPRADGSQAARSRPSTNHSRIRTGRAAERRRRLDQNQRLLEELQTNPFDELDSEPDAEPADEPGQADTSEPAEGAIVRSIESARSRPRTLAPQSFADAKEIGDEFKRGTPVVVNLQGLDRDLVRRLVDFASGICYALDGSMEKLASQVFLLTPDGLDVSDDDRRRIEQRGYAR